MTPPINPDELAIAVKDVYSVQLDKYHCVRALAEFAKQTLEAQQAQEFLCVKCGQLIRLKSPINTPFATNPKLATEQAEVGVVDIERLVCHDITKRQQIGITKYGQTVADNPLPLKQWLQHAYEECLDQSIYLKRAMEELP